VFLEEAFSGQGETTLVRSVMPRVGGRWIGAGTVVIGEDNNGNSGAGGFGDPCWSYTSSVAVEPQLSGGLPVLVLTRRGTMYDGPGRVKRADGTVRAIFNGTAYAEEGT